MFFSKRQKRSLLTIGCILGLTVLFQNCGGSGSFVARLSGLQKGPVLEEIRETLLTSPQVEVKSAEFAMEDGEKKIKLRYQVKLPNLINGKKIKHNEITKLSLYWFDGSEAGYRALDWIGDVAISEEEQEGFFKIPDANKVSIESLYLTASVSAGNLLSDKMQLNPKQIVVRSANSGFKEDGDTLIPGGWQSKLLARENGKWVEKEIDGFKLKDFSYAGYHRGEKPLPNAPPTHTLSPGPGDDTKRLQDALNRAVGGVLLLKEGEFNLTEQVVIPSRTVLRGSGPDKTFIRMNKDKDTEGMSILIGYRSTGRGPKANRFTSSSIVLPIVGSVPSGSTKINLRTVDGVKIGDWVVVKNEITDSLRKEYNFGRTDLWSGSDGFAFLYIRQIKDIQGTNITIDHPTEHLLNERDKPKILLVNDFAQEIGIEHLSIGYLRPAVHPLEGNASKVSHHNARGISFSNVINGWIRNVHSYSPDKTGIHLHSGGIHVYGSRWVTVTDSKMGPTSNRGGGGNGYLFAVGSSNHVLFINNHASGGRHNFLFNSGVSGSVWTGNYSEFDALESDTHGSFNHNNLIDDMGFGEDKVREGGLAATIGLRFRDPAASGGMGTTAAGNVIWNVRETSNKMRYANVNQLNINGTRSYVIGISGLREGSPNKTEGLNWVEGVGNPEKLNPQSLYKVQLKNRLLNYK